jgi:hypothetical protein
MDRSVRSSGASALRVVVAVLAVIATSGCSSATHPVPRVLTHWDQRHLPRAFAADHRALVVEAAGPPRTVPRARALQLAHDVLQDSPSGKAVVTGMTGCDRCFTLTSRIVAVRSGRVTLAVPGSTRAERPRQRPAWVIAYAIPGTEGCPFWSGSPTAPASASGLQVLVIDGPHRADVVAYRGTGTGACRPRIHPELNHSPVPGVDPGAPL